MSDRFTAARPDAPARLPQAQPSSGLRHTEPASSRGPTSRRRRVTLVQCMLNSNQSNGGSLAVAELQHFLEGVLFTQSGLARLLLHAATRRGAKARHIERVDISAAAIEIGARQQRVHAHWVMKIVHADLQLNVGLMQGELQRMCREHTSFTSPYAHIDLLSAAAENYALKEQFVSSDDDDSEFSTDTATT